MSEVILQKMPNLVDLGAFKLQKVTAQNKQLANKMSNVDINNRIFCIKESINRINALMSELKDISKNPYNKN